ncbi:hypothetical protein ACFPN2_34290 [Steroidobacter flavus]|uniref:Uncharacterized protein n=1 Tax=Steroidobacter flavus TaxID=1842136 RepID=A0ABV8T2V0_9GAMM
MSRDEVTPDVFMKWPMISRADEFTAKEVALDLTHLTPKARDNLSLQDMDITVSRVRRRTKKSPSSIR